MEPAVTWQDYVHVLLMESGNVARAAIHGTKDGQLLGCTEDLCLSQEQVANLVRGFEDCTHLRTEGVQVGSETFTLTRVTDHRIMVGRDACTGGGCVIYRCDSCLIAAVYEDGNHPGGCYTLVTRLGDFLVERGY
ncbi:profilin-like isoform X2 [Pomacea canaliculata]|uniref:profilin-like isoform X2 n=1 Tax=Pomacea canaliculata TaxID=400727 RepID=UPI000D73CCE3|nr:profilin-like isoform X2 [Pomacea canaliculata]